MHTNPEKDSADLLLSLGILFLLAILVGGTLKMFR